MDNQSNRLPILAAEITQAHDNACRAAQTTVVSAISAGERLLEAKALLGHGKWLPWFTENFDFSERTARNYMRLAKHRESVQGKSAAVADLTVQGALEHLTETEAMQALLPPTGVARIWSDSDGRHFLISQDPHNPGYYNTEFLDFREGAGEQGHGLVVTSQRPIKWDFILEGLKSDWPGIKPSTLRALPFVDCRGQEGLANELLHMVG